MKGSERKEKINDFWVLDLSNWVKVTVSLLKRNTLRG